MTRFLKAPGSAEHRKVQELLSAYLDGEVSPDERILTERHMSQCEECARSLRNLEDTVRLLKRLPPVNPPRSFVLSQAPPRTSRLRIFSWGYPLLQGATALAALLLVIVMSADIALQTVSSPRFQPSMMPAAKEMTPKLSQEALSPMVGLDLGLETAAYETDIETEEEIPAPQLPADEAAPSEEKEREIVARSPEEAMKAEADQEPQPEASEAVDDEGVEVPTATPSTPDEAMEVTGGAHGQEAVPAAKAGEPAELPTTRSSSEATEVAAVPAMEKGISEPSTIQPTEASPSSSTTEVLAPGLSRFLRWGEVGLLSLFTLLLAATLFIRRRRRHPRI